MAEDKKRTGDEDSQKSGIRPAQVGAATLAAVTAAFLCSTLGVYGTVLGAGLLSLITTLGSELYVRWLDKTKVAARAISDVRVRRGGERDPARGRHPDTGGNADTGTDTTALLPLPGHARPGPEARWGQQGPVRPGERPERRAWWKRRGPLIVGTSAVAFVIGMLVVTGYEGVTGNALSGQGGTTVSSLVGGGSGRDDGQWRDQRPEQDTPTDEQSTDQRDPGEQQDQRDQQEEATPTRDGEPAPGVPEESGEATPTERTGAPETTQPDEDTGTPEQPTGEPEPTGQPEERTQVEPAVPTR